MQQIFEDGREETLHRLLDNASSDMSKGQREDEYTL